MNDREHPQAQWQPSAAAAAWAVPGLGHYILGEKRRGIIIGSTIILLWLIGTLVGGIGVLDRKQQPAWFLAQMLTAPSVITDLVIQKQIKPRYPPPRMPDQPRKYDPSLGRAQEQGILFTALAGLLNLLAIIDVVYYDPARRTSRRRSSEMAA